MEEEQEEGKKEELKGKGVAGRAEEITGRGAGQGGVALGEEGRPG